MPEPTARLRFREMTEADLDLMSSMLGDPAVMRFYPRPKTRLESLEWIRWNRANYTTYGYGLWIVETHDGSFVGDCGLTWQPVGDTRILEVGFHTVPAQQRQWYAVEAARACLDLATGRVGESHVVAVINPANTASRRTAERLGMTVEQPEAMVHGRTAVIYGCRSAIA